MEFLTTPDISAGARWARTPASATLPPSKHPTPLVSSASASASVPVSAPVPSAPSAAVTPAPSSALPPFLDRAGIKSSFQSLFSPSPNVATPALLPPRPAPSPAPGLTPFIAGFATPSLVPPSSALFSSFPHQPPQSNLVPSSAHPQQDPILTSPFLQAAAKEAVRREFMNMPNYVASQPSHNERAVPTSAVTSSTTPTVSPHHPDQSAHMARASPNPSKSSSPPQVPPSPSTPVSNPPPASPQHSTSDAKVPVPSQPTSSHSQPTSNPAPASTAASAISSHYHQPYFMAHPHAPGGMVFVDPRGHIMMAPPQAHPHPAATHPAAAFYPAAHPYGMMMFAGQHPMMQQPMVMPQATHAAHPSAHHVQPSAPTTSAAPSARPSPPSAPTPEQQSASQPPTSTATAAPSMSTTEVTPPKPEPPSAAAMAAAAAAVAGGLTSTASTASDAKGESQSEKKARIEHEKQELIREFKKKTREAALVRFRQKRSERRFGKLIRYDCRKKLADARPRVKGRFVRIKEDEIGEDDSESAQVVPGYIER